MFKTTVISTAIVISTISMSNATDLMKGDYYARTHSESSGWMANSPSTPLYFCSIGGNVINHSNVFGAMGGCGVTYYPFGSEIDLHYLPYSKKSVSNGKAGNSTLSAELNGFVYPLQFNNLHPYVFAGGGALKLNNKITPSYDWGLGTKINVTKNVFVDFRFERTYLTKTTFSNYNSFNLGVGVVF